MFCLFFVPSEIHFGFSKSVSLMFKRKSSYKFSLGIERSMDYHSKNICEKTFSPFFSKFTQVFPNFFFSRNSPRLPLNNKFFDEGYVRITTTGSAHMMTVQHGFDKNSKELVYSSNRRVVRVAELN